jgi:hypothetical protein
VIEHSRVITWQRSVAESYRDDRSVASARTSHTASRQTVAPASVAPSKAPTVVSQAPSAAPKAHSKAPSIASMASTATAAANMVRSVSAPIVPQTTSSSTPTDNGAAKTLIGTLLGAAAGAAVAYAMCKSEQDSAKKEKEFVAFMEAKAQQAQPVAQAIEQPKLSIGDPQPIYEAPPKSVHRNINDTASQYSASQPRTVRAIEPAPSSYYAPPMYAVAPARSVAATRSVAPARSVAPTRVEERQQIEYIPAYSIAPSRTQLTTAHRSFTSPELTTVAKAKSTVSKAYSHAPSSLISSFVPEQPVRRLTEGSVHSHNSSKSKSRSKEKSSDSDSHVSKSRSKDRPSDSDSHVSKHSSHSKHTAKTRSRAPSPPPVSIVDKAQSVIGSILGRDSKSTVSKKDDEDDDLIDDFDFDEEYIEDGTDTVAPSDSISNAGSSSRRSHRSHKSSRKSAKDGSSSSEVSGHSSSSKDSKHSRSSKHSKHSHSHHTSSERKRSLHEGSSPLRESWSADDDKRSKVLSETSDVSTVKPIKSKSHRKDSLMAGQYDNLFNGAQYGSGSVAAMPIRGITPSMVEVKEAKKGSGNKSMINFALAQKLRAFEQ